MDRLLFVVELLLLVKELRWLLVQVPLSHRLVFLWEMFGVVADVDSPVKE